MSLEGPLAVRVDGQVIFYSPFDIGSAIVVDRYSEISDVGINRGHFLYLVSTPARIIVVDWSRYRAVDVHI